MPTCLPEPPFKKNVGILLFEFSKFYPSDYQHGRDFVSDLDKFLGQLPAGWPYGVEIRNKNFLHPEYLQLSSSTASRTSSIPGPECPP